MSAMALEIADWISVNRAAEILGCTPGRVRQLLGENRLTGEKLDGTSIWMVSCESVENYGKQDLPPGRPRIGA